jgi:hypothetical protein
MDELEKARELLKQKGFDFFGHKMKFKKVTVPKGEHLHNCEERVKFKCTCCTAPFGFSMEGTWQDIIDASKCS